MQNSVKTFAALAAVLAIASVAPAQNLLSNGGFESAFGSNSNGNWVAFGNAYQVTSAGPTAHSGTGTLKMFGTFPGTSGVFQDFAASAGQQFSMSGFGQNWSQDAMQPNNLSVLKLTFFDSSNNEITSASLTSNAIDSTSTADTWIAQSTGIGTAPTGTAYGRAFVLFIQPGTNAGSSWTDDVSVQAAPEPITLIALAGGVLGVCLLKRSR